MRAEHRDGVLLLVTVVIAWGLAWPVNKVVLQSLRGDEGILKAMKSNEDETNARYERALMRSDLTPQCRRILEENLSDERRHRAWILSQLGQMSRV